MSKNVAAQHLPEKARTNPLLDHGPAGWLIVRLQRHALAGWIVAAVVIGLHFLVLLVSTITPRPVIVVDQAGREVGYMEYLKPTTRSDQDVTVAAMHYLSSCLSLNSATIYDDYAHCMNLQTPALQAATKAAITADNYLPRIEKAKARSWLEFSTGANAPAVISRNGNDIHVRLKGNINTDLGGKYAEPKPFDVTLLVRPAARNTLNTSGITVVESRDN